MKRKAKDGIFYQVRVTFKSGEKLVLTCGDYWTAHEAARESAKVPGVDSAVYESHGYSLFNSTESALATVRAYAR